MMQRSRIVLFAFMLSIWVPGSLCQQIDSQILGQVLDPSGAAVSAASVTATRVETGAIRHTLSNSQGLYSFTFLNPGNYTLAVEADGFRKMVQEPTLVELGDHIETDFKLEIGETSEEINVRTQRSLLDTTNATIGGVIPNHFIVNLPLNGRNFLQLALLLPGAVPAAVGSPGSERGRFAMQANGARESANSFLYDGVYAIDPILNSFSLAPAVDAVREFRVLTSNSDAGLGRNSGAQIAVAIQQGTNDLHGTAYEFFRNDRLDARNFFSRPDDPIPALRRNQFGASLGGAVVKKHSIFLCKL